MKIGTVIRWNNFPHQKDQEIKPRWFIYMGRYRYGATNHNVYLYTTTTQHHYYESGFEREHHQIIRFSKSQYGFAEDCVLDIDLGLHTVQEEEIENNPDIEEVGQLPPTDLKRIYASMWKSNKISYVIMKDIHTSLNMEGISGLRRPRK